MWEDNPAIIEGFKHYPRFLGLRDQMSVLAAVRRVIKQAPLYRARMPRTGKELRVQQTNCGFLGWYSDEIGGYRYQTTHPVTGNAWPAIPTEINRVLDRIEELPNNFVREACLINKYTDETVLGMHRDADEEATEAPIVMISLGDSAIFVIGGLSRDDPKHEIMVQSGDVVVMGGKSRMAWHGVNSIIPCTSRLLGEARGRFALTIRQVHKQRVRQRPA